MSKVLLDTDIASELTKRKNITVLSRKEEYLARESFYYLSTITVMEIVKGFAKTKQEDKIATFLTSLKKTNLLKLDLDSSILAGRILSGLDLIGRPIGNIDPIIAAIAITHKLTLVTGNTTHYQWIKELGFPLNIDNWRD